MDKDIYRKVQMFIGEYQHSVDSKGRVAIPAKFRAALKKGAVVTRGLDKCLFLYPKKDWNELAAKLANLPISQKDARAFARLMLAGAMDVDVDKQGRINLPSYLRDYSTVKNNAVITGLYNRLEIWDSKEWEQYKNNAEKESSDIAEHLGNLGV